MLLRRNPLKSSLKNGIGLWRSPFRRGAGSVLVFLGMAGLALSGAKAHAQGDALACKGDGVLARLSHRPARGWISVIVRTDHTPAARQEARLKALHADVYRHLTLIHSLALRVPGRNLERLASLPFVTHLSLDAPLRKNDEFTVDSSEADVAAADYGLNGAGVTVAVVDSGIYPHPDLAGAVLASVDFTGDAAPGDPCGHGTHVAGIIAGSGAASSGPNCFRTFYGIAPKASLVSVRVLHANGVSDVSTVINGIQWVVANQALYNIRIMNLSIGHPVLERSVTDPLCQAVEQAWKSGIFVVCAAGNNGRLWNQANPLLPSELPPLDSSNAPVLNEGYLTNYGTIESPGNDPYVITVGAMKSHDGIRADDRIATYSSRGPSLGDHILKPDIVAPGNQVISLLSPGSYLDNLVGATNDVYPSAYMIGADPNAPAQYLTLSGTSMATPVVSGAAALMLQAQPGLTPDTLKARLMASADKWAFRMGMYDAMTFGAGYLNIPAALQSTVTTTQWALSPDLHRSNLPGTVQVDQSHAIWGNNGVWGSSQLPNPGSIYGPHAIWGNGTLSNGSTIWDSHAIWGNTSASGSMSTEVDMSTITKLREKP